MVDRWRVCDTFKSGLIDEVEEMKENSEYNEKLFKMIENEARKHGRLFQDSKPVDTRHPNQSKYNGVADIDQAKIESMSLLDVANSDWFDYKTQKAVALPPVGEKVEVFLHWSESWSGWVVIVGHDHDGVIWRNGSDNKSYIYSPRSEIRPLDHATRKAEAEKKRVVDAVIEAYDKAREDKGLLQAFNELYDLGYLRIPSK